jgi:hypothetical protein
MHIAVAPSNLGIREIFRAYARLEGCFGFLRCEGSVLFVLNGNLHSSILRDSQPLEKKFGAECHNT